MSLKIMTELDIKPGKGQTQEEAEAEFAKRFDEYLSNDDSQFLIDYGPAAWGGYEGPTVAAVRSVVPVE